MPEDGTNYYKKFNYVIQKKLCVDDHKSLKDLAKKQCYLYIIFDPVDRNRFLFISSKHYEDLTPILPSTFTLNKLSDKNDSIFLKYVRGAFNELHFDLVSKKENSDVAIIPRVIMEKQNKDGKFYDAYKIHNKKIAIDNPDWYVEVIKKGNVKSHKKKFERLILKDNVYADEIWQHFISTLFEFKHYEYQRFNDHSLVLDQGKTGKSTLIPYGNNKIDDVSLAGLYGSSDAKAGKFKGGLVTRTKGSIWFDECMEIIKKHQSSKIKPLSIINSPMENGIYYYLKQHSHRLEISNQLGCIANVEEGVNLPIILEGLFGNLETIGRRFGVITYNTKIKKFIPKTHKPSEFPEYCYAIKQYLTNVYNYIFFDTKYVNKLQQHPLLDKLRKEYVTRLAKLCNGVEDETTLKFISSHKEGIERLTTRALKLLLYSRIDKFLLGEVEYYNSVLPFDVIQKTRDIMELNIMNLEHVKEHVNSSAITSLKSVYNKQTFDRIKDKSFGKLLQLFAINKDNLTSGGCAYRNLQGDKSGVKVIISHYKNKRRSVDGMNNFLLEYGCKLILKPDDLYFFFISRERFHNYTAGMFDELGEEIEVKSNVEESIQEVAIDNDVI